MWEAEIWRPTKYIGYEVSDLGRVRTKWILGSRGRGGGKGRIAILTDTWRPAHVYAAKRGYLRVSICTAAAQGGTPHAFIHRLVVEAFLPNPNNWPDVNHKNGIKTDNRLSNLERSYPAHNNAHAKANGLLRWQVGEERYCAKLTEKDVREILTMPNDGHTYKEIGEVFGISGASVADIFAGKTWRHVTGL